MAASYTWPGSLPATPTTSYSEDFGINIIRSPMDAGPAKMRRRSNRPKTMSCTFEMTNYQITQLESFVSDTLRGTARFYFTNPRTGTTVEARLVPQQDGQLYTVSYLNYDVYNVSMKMEILP
jgi:hypothetical protein